MLPYFILNVKMQYISHIHYDLNFGFIQVRLLNAPEKILEGKQPKYLQWLSLTGRITGDLTSNTRP